MIVNVTAGGTRNKDSDQLYTQRAVSLFNDRTMAFSERITDNDTRRLFAVIAWCLSEYCDHTPDSAIDALNRFYERFHERLGDDFFHHYGPYWSALLIHYVEAQAGTIEDFESWRHTQGPLRTPPEALAYYREHYFVKPT